MSNQNAEWLFNREPWSNPQYTPNSPHNIPRRELAQSTTPGVGESLSVREGFRYASLIEVSLTIGTTSVKFLDQPIAKRNMLGFRNASSVQNIYISFNSDATLTTWLKITPGAMMLFDTVVPQDDLYAIADAANAVLTYVYSTFPG
jgi:hypothetical protein